MIHVAGGVVWNKDLGVAVVSQNHDSWSLPKGHVEPGESTLDAAKREIEEETGIPQSTLVFVREIANYNRERIKRNPTDAVEMRHITLYFFTTTHQTLAPKDPINPEARWVPPSNVPSLLSHPIDKKEFERIIQLDLFQ